VEKGHQYSDNDDQDSQRFLELGRIRAGLSKPVNIGLAQVATSLSVGGRSKLSLQQCVA
jgi:hypothetical protein